MRGSRLRRHTPRKTLKPSRGDSGVLVTSSNRQARLHIEFAHTVDPAQWQRLHSAGLIPDRLPYGLDRLSDHGFEVVVRPVSHSLPIRLFAGAARRATGGLE